MIVQPATRHPAPRGARPARRPHLVRPALSAPARGSVKL